MLEKLAQFVPMILSAAMAVLVIAVIVKKTVKSYRTSKPKEPVIIHRHAVVTNKYIQPYTHYSKIQAPVNSDKYMVEFTLDDRKVPAFDLPMYYDSFDLLDSGTLETEDGVFVNFTLDKKQ